MRNDEKLIKDELVDRLIKFDNDLFAINGTKETFYFTIVGGSALNKVQAGNIIRTIAKNIKIDNIKLSLRGLTKKYKQQ